MDVIELHWEVIKRERYTKSQNVYNFSRDML